MCNFPRKLENNLQGKVYISHGTAHNERHWLEISFLNA